MSAAMFARQAPPDVSPERYVLDPHSEPSRLGLPAVPSDSAHLDGVTWSAAPMPPRRHVCWPQTVVGLDGSGGGERCACGAFRGHGSRRWSSRNQRRWGRLSAIRDALVLDP